MKRIYLECGLALVAAMVANGAWAADEAGEKGSTSAQPGTATNATSIESLVQEALEKNPELRFYQAEIAAAKAGRKSAALWANPEVNGTVGQKNSREKSSGASAEGVAWSVSVVQPFEWPGRIGLRKAIANRDVMLAELGLERFKALREVLVQRDPAGVAPLLETRVIEATELTMQRKASEAELGTQTALLQLNQLRGAAPGAVLAVAEPPLQFGPADSNAVLLAVALTNNFELRVRATELAQQGFRVALAKNERFPAISVGPSYSEENAFDRERIIGVGVSFPLPLWNRNSANIEAATARQLQAETSYTVAQREVERKVMEAALVYERKVREMGKWRADAVQHFQEAAELADRHYRLGAVPVSTYVELQKQYFEAVESLLDTKKEALEAAQNLELLTGVKLPITSTK